MNLTQALCVLDAVKIMLKEKNRMYGDSASKPKRVFSSADEVEQVLVRLDDKLSRWQSSQPDDPEGRLELIKDMIGYLAFLGSHYMPEE